MAALFYSPNDGSSIFKGGYQINTSVRIPFLNNLVGDTGFTIINNVAVQNADTTQFFVTFDDFISYFYFGKGIGSININGTMYTDCNGRIPGVDIFYAQISRFRGRPVLVSFGSAVFTGVITTFAADVVSEPAPVVEFSINLSVIDHSLGSPTFTPLC